MINKDSWQEYKIDSLISNKSEKYNPINSKEDFPCIEMEHLSQGGTGILLGSVNSLGQKSIKNKFRPNDTLFGKLRPYLRKWHKANFYGVCSSEIWVLTPKSKILTKDFLYYIVQSSSFQKEIDSTTGSKMPRADWSIVAELTVLVPSLPEQKEIAEFFSVLDERIELTAEKVKLLKEQKQGYLQKIFNRELVFTDDNGNTYPEWEKKKLGEVASIVGGGTPPTGEPSFWDGQINWFSPTEVGKAKYLTESARKITELGLKNSSAKIHPAGTVLLTTRASLGRMGILRKEAATNQGFQSLLPKENTTSEFLYYLQSQISAYCDAKASGSTFREISGKEISKMTFLLPSLPEQKKIAEFFSALDEQIELNENKLALLKEQKKGYLQGVFG